MMSEASHGTGAASRVNVVVAGRLGEHNVRRVGAVSPAIAVTDISEAALWVSGRPPFGAVGTGQPMLAVDSPAVRKARGCLAEADVVLGGTIAPWIVPLMPRLKWLQLVSAGIDYLAGTGLLEKDIAITTARGCGAAAMAEHVMASVFMHAKNVMLYLRNKQMRMWERCPAIEVNGKTMGLVGLGAVGFQVARLASLFGMQIVATKRSPEQGREHWSEIEGLEVTGDLTRVLRAADFVALTLPLTSHTRRLIGLEQLRLMKPSACLINVSRGAIVDEAALVEALRSGLIAGASLDVFEREPLPADSPLWEMPNVYVSPHHSGEGPGYYDRVTDLFCENLRRYLRGEALCNLVDRQIGY